ncbi:hypothetical protein [Bradyrhizobium sp. 1200_D9_N1_1]
MHELVTKADISRALENLKSSLTIRLGSIVVAGVAALAVILGLH